MTFLIWQNKADSPLSYLLTFYNAMVSDKVTETKSEN